MFRTITNTAAGPRGVWTETGMKWLEPGQTRDLDVSESVLAGLTADFALAEIAKPEEPKPAAKPKAARKA